MFGTVSQASQASLFFMIGYTTSLNLEQNSPKRITAQLFYKAAFDLAKPGLAVEQKKKNPPITYSTLPHWFPLIRPAFLNPTEIPWRQTPRFGLLLFFARPWWGGLVVKRGSVPCGRSIAHYTQMASGFICRGFVRIPFIKGGMKFIQDRWSDCW